MSNKNNNFNNSIERIFSQVPKRCNCCACVELHKAVKNESGISRYQELCKSFGIYSH